MGFKIIYRYCNKIAENITRKMAFRVINGKGNKGESIKWEYSKDKKYLDKNAVRVFRLDTHELTLNVLDKVQNLAKLELKK